MQAVSDFKDILCRDGISKGRTPAVGLLPDICRWELHLLVAQLSSLGRLLMQIRSLELTQE